MQPAIFKSREAPESFKPRHLPKAKFRGELVHEKENFFAGSARLVENLLMAAPSTFVSIS